VRDLAQHFDYLVLRFFMLGGHYRMPINFTTDLLTAAQNGWNRIRTCQENLDFVIASATTPEQVTDEPARLAAAELDRAGGQGRTDFIQAMDDDLNTADALAAVFELVRAANTAASVPGIDRSSLRKAARVLTELLDVLGLHTAQKDEIPAEIMTLVQARVAAKKARDFAKADALRDEILAKGYSVADTPQGPKVSIL
jgi:cysteinyl-tRNA synthetase